VNLMANLIVAAMEPARTPQASPLAMLLALRFRPATI
jgi:hypothetical protein